MARVTAAHATRSPRNFGKMMPSLTASTWWLARPIRCMPLATEGGASICTTRSIAPMSMPSSSEEVATRAGMRPAFSASSISMRCSRDSDPWCARATVSPASSLIAPASRSARRRLFTNSSVVRCARISSSRRGWMLDQIDPARRALRCRAARDLDRPGKPGQVLDRHFDRQREPLRLARVDDGDRAKLHARVAGVELAAQRAFRRRIVLAPPVGPHRPGFPRPALGRHAAGALPGRPAEKARDLVERPLRRRQADALDAAVRRAAEAFERQREVRAALGGDQRVDLVDDDRVDGAEHVARARGQQQVERLRAW